MISFNPTTTRKSCTSCRSFVYNNLFTFLLCHNEVVYNCEKQRSETIYISVMADGLYKIIYFDKFNDAVLFYDRLQHELDKYDRTFKAQEFEDFLNSFGFN